MPRRPLSRPTGEYTAFELPDCRCKLTMLPLCVLRVQPRCRDLRHTGKCQCAKRELPVCLAFDGCRLLRAGKPCQCERTELPACMALGCELRRQGRMCQCPRWPGEPCKHVLELAQKIRLNRPAEYERWLHEWIEELRAGNFEGYTDRPEGAPAVALTQEERVLLREGRESMGLELFCAGDVLFRPVSKAAEIQHRREIEARKAARRYDFLGLLSRKGGDNGAA